MKKRLTGMGLSALMIGMQMTAVLAEIEESVTINSKEAQIQEIEEEMAVQISDATNLFGKTLMAELVKTGENVFISPYSITSALSMLGHASEQGEQIEEVWELIGFDKYSENEIFEGQKELMERLSPEYGMDDLSDFERKMMGIGTVEIANAFYIDDEVKLLPSFEKLEEILDGYEAEIAVKSLETKETMDEINSWVSEKTHEMIKSVLEQPMNKDIALMLLNTVYFKGNWSRPFAEDGTITQPFYGTDGEKEVEMMRQQDRFAYFETEEYQIVRLPYMQCYEMCVYLPKKIETCEKWSDAAYLSEFLSMECLDESREVLLSMPKFELEYSKELKDVLVEMGVSKIFDGWSYDRISEDPLAVGSILHKTALKNNEKGTEASAVTAIMVAAMAFVEKEEPVEMTIDKPFYFTITHTELGLNLFEGCVMNLGE